MKYSSLAVSIAALLNTPAIAFATTKPVTENAIERIEVAGQSLNSQGLSVKDATINGPFGDNLALQDIARLVTPISKELI